jgi:uncharacterized protein YdaU (DUF1376 family)
VKADAWMPFYPADYLRKTMRLTRDQHGGYFLLLLACWDGGGRLPNDESELAAIVKASTSEWRKLAPKLLPFFSVEGEWLVHGRVLEEYEKAARMAETSRANGRKGGRPRSQEPSGNKPDGNPPNNPAGFLQDTQRGTQSETPALVARPSPTPEDKDADASFVAGKPNDAVRIAVDEWNALAARLGLPQARTIDRSRKAAIHARLSEGGMDAWRQALAAVERSDHCRGQNDRGWKADIDFVCQPKSWRRLLEGFYGGAPVQAAAAVPEFTGPAEIRRAVVASGADGERVALGYLDPCGWDAGRRQVIAPNSFMAKTLEAKVGAALRAVGVHIVVNDQPERKSA